MAASLVGWQGKFKLLPKDKLPEPPQYDLNWNQDFVIDRALIKNELNFKETTFLDECLMETNKYIKSVISNYQPKLVKDANEKGLLECSPLSAKEWCNFVVFMPDYLPSNYIITKQQLRRESPSNPCSFRFLLENKEDNQKNISIKQFLYDWAPPAYDYPCLWLNTKKFSPSDIPSPHPVLVGNRVLWIGKNYRGQNAATIDLERTRIEITFDNIDLSDEELVKLIQGMQPTDESTRKQILNTSFGFLSYFYRHKKNASDVPLSYWRHMRNNKCYVVVLDQFQKDVWLKNYENVINRYNYNLNTIFAVLDESDVEVEREYLFEHNQAPGVFIHLLASSIDSKYPIQIPPKIGDQACKYQTIKVNETEFYVAYLEKPYGNYEFVWRLNDIIYLMIIRAVSWVTEKWVFDFVAKMHEYSK